MKLVTAGQMRALEAAAFAAGATPEGLMENAGRAVARAVHDHLGISRARRVIILVGPGNNGGDGLVAARYLHDDGAEVTVYLLAPRSEDDANLKAVRERDIETVVLEEEAARAALDAALTRADAVIDAILGTGRLRPLSGAVAAALDAVKARRCPLFAVDLPTGLDPDTGVVDLHCAAADFTLTLGYSKLGLHLLPGSHYVGQVEVLDIGLDAALGVELDVEMMTPSWARAALPERPLISNKGTFGRVLVVAGSLNYTGAATLACLGALRAGAGLVTLACLPEVRAAVAAQLPEVTFQLLPEEDGDLAPAAGDAVVRGLGGYDVLLLGPGLGQSHGAQAMVRGVLSAPQLQEVHAVVDADALNALARQQAWHESMAGRAVLTPHPGELARLINGSIAEVQADRLSTSRGSAAAWQQTLVLKGAQTVIAGPDGRVLISPFANALLATAGTGDVLAGTIAGLLAQGLDPFSAAGLGVYLHGAAGELFADNYGPSGLLAGELGGAIARVAAQLRRGE